MYVLPVPSPAGPALPFEPLSPLPGASGSDPAAAGRKARGAFFTPPAICRFMVDWAVRSASDRVLEPACGEAAFLLAAGTRLAALGAVGDKADRLHGIDQLHGVELHDQSVLNAVRTTVGAGVACTIHVGSFFDAEPGPEPGRFDAVVGNPPYVRYQDFGGDARRKGRARALAQGVRLSGLASSWAPFVIHAASFLGPDGRMALVLPAELLSVNYAAPVRAFLMDRFASVRLVLFEERVFPGVLEEVVLLLAEGTGPTDHFAVQQVRDASGLDAVVGHGASWTPAVGHDKWLPALLPTGAAEVYRVLTAGPFPRLDTWGDTYLGAVTGNNSYFALSGRQAAAAGLQPGRDLVPVSPPGSRHLRGLAFTAAAWERLVSEGRQGLLFWPRGDKLSTAAARYVAAGEAAGVPGAYKCRVRRPWWRTPLVPTADLLLTYMNHSAPRLVRNAAGVAHLNSVHGVRLRPGRRRLGADLLPIATLNSVTLLGAETVGRSYGGGMLKLEPTEADALPVPAPELLQRAGPALRAVRPAVARALAGGDLEEAVALVDGAVLAEAAGLCRGDVEQLRAARTALFARRVARA